MSRPQSHDQLLSDLGLGDEDRVAWEQSGLPDAAFEEWVIDRVARRPSGNTARAVYGADDVHDFARRAILEVLALTPEDLFLDVGCGGGLLLRDAQALGTSATGVDHSADMVQLARQRAPGSEVTLGNAEELPFPDGSFTAVAMSIVFMFLDAPETALGESKRVLAPGGRIAVYTAAPELRGTAAAPEPVASHGHFYPDEQLITLANSAGFRGAHVDNDGGGQLLTAHV